ncbi:MAG: winged helix-turn-helix domain-containing protein [Anaerolineae bacterium]|nr:winged helix-turn-helix domain-containing protein [Anaerolineae bacterium]
MAIKVYVTPDDLLETRFAYNPLVELSISYHMLRSEKSHSLYRKWVDTALRALHGVDLPFMDALIQPGVHYIPDFMTPTPRIVQTNIEHAIREMLNTPEIVIRKNIQTLFEHGGESDIGNFFLAYPYEALHCLAEELRLYWRRALEPHWPGMTAILEGDLIHHARAMALHGPGHMLNGIDTAMLRYQEGVIEIIKPHRPSCGDEYRLNGDGLQLVPAFFGACGIQWQIEPEWQPMIIYTARGVGNWRPRSQEDNPSLELALGEGRARVLQTLSIPSNTGEIARRLHISAGAASQHLGRLQQAGLVEPHRSGRRVFYRLTDRGTQLLVLFDLAV